MGYDGRNWFAVLQHSCCGCFVRCVALYAATPDGLENAHQLAGALLSSWVDGPLPGSAWRVGAVRFTGQDAELSPADGPGVARFPMRGGVSSLPAVCAASPAGEISSWDLAFFRAFGFVPRGL